MDRRGRRRLRRSKCRRAQGPSARSAGERGGCAPMPGRVGVGVSMGAVCVFWGVISAGGAGGRCCPTKRPTTSIRISPSITALEHRRRWLRAAGCTRTAYRRDARARSAPQRSPSSAQAAQQQAAARSSRPTTPHPHLLFQKGDLVFFVPGVPPSSPLPFPLRGACKTEGSSNWAAGVSSRAPSGLNVSGGMSSCKSRPCKVPRSPRVHRPPPPRAERGSDGERA